MAKSDWGYPIGVILALCIFAFLISNAKNPETPVYTSPSSVTLDSEAKRAAEFTIRANGYFCPSANFALKDGVRPEGISILVYCGPPDEPHNAFEKLVYHVIVAGPRKGLAFPEN